MALGAVALVAGCLEALAHYRPRLPRLALATVLSVLAMGCTPLRFSLVSDVLLSPARPDFRYITEWQPAGRELWTFGFFLLVARVGALVLRFRSHTESPGTGARRRRG